MSASERAPGVTLLFGNETLKPGAKSSEMTALNGARPARNRRTSLAH
jgi:hypothetical protein